MRIHCKDLPKYIDISAVRTDCTYQEVMEVARIAKKYKFICAFAMPCFTKMLGEELKGSGVMLGGTAGFPSGAAHPPWLSGPASRSGPSSSRPARSRGRSFMREENAGYWVQ